MTALSLRAGSCRDAGEWRRAGTGPVNAARHAPDDAHDATAMRTGGDGGGLARRAGRRCRRGLRSDAFVAAFDERPAEREVGGAMSVGHEAEGADAVEAVRCPAGDREAICRVSVLVKV